MTGRLLGTREMSIEQIKKIVELTEEDCPRREIARQVGCDFTTVYRLQCKIDLI